MDDVDYASMLPAYPSAELLDWAKTAGAPWNEYLIYRADSYLEPLTGERVQAVLLRCTVCGGEQHADKLSAGGCHNMYAPAPFGFLHPTTGESIISGKTTLCPMCGAKVGALHIGSLRSPVCNDVYVTEIGRLARCLTLTEWCVRRVTAKDEAPRFEAWPYHAYIVEDKKIIRCVGYIQCMSTRKLLGHWEQRKSYRDTYGECGLLYPWDKRILEGSTAENSKLDVYAAIKGAHLVSYLKIWRKHPNAENLVTQGAAGLLEEMISEVQLYYPSPTHATPKLEKIDWKAKRPSLMLGLSRDEFKHCVSQKWGATELKLYKELREGGNAPKLPEDMGVIKRVGAVSVIELLNGGYPVMKTMRYLDRQKGQEDGTSFVNASYWLDYLRMLRDNGEKDDAAARYPKDLRREHNRVLREIQQRRDEKRARERAEAMEKRRAAFEKRFGELERFSWEQGGLLIRPCRDENELIAEGKALHHCVGSYAQRVADGETAILFIRRVKRPDEPYYTLELDEKTLEVRQNRGKQNCDRTKTVTEFEGKWLEHIRALKKPGGKRAAKKKGAAA